MANILGVYNPIFYAQEALMQLEKALGMAGRVHRGFEDARNTFGKGDVINVRRPSVFTALNAPAAAVDLNTETVAITLDQWKEVKFKLSDKELAYTGQRIVEDHIRPAAYALADNIDIALATEYQKVPWTYDTAGATVVVADLVGARKVMFDNAVPMSSPLLHGMLNGTGEADLLQLSNFSQHQGAGEVGVDTQRSGFIGQKYGYEFFANQNVQTHSEGTLAATAGALTNGTHAFGASVINIDDATALTGTINAGDILTVAGFTQKYAVTANALAAGNAAAISVSPSLQTAIGDGVAVTFDQEATKVEQNLLFHQNAFTLAMARLPDFQDMDPGNTLGASIASVQSPNGLAVRSRIYYVGNSSEIHVALDVLYGVQTIDPNLAVRLRDA